MSFLRARSPVTPKTTKAHGSGTRGSRRSRGSRSGLSAPGAPSTVSVIVRLRTPGVCRSRGLFLELRLDGLDQLGPGLLELVDPLVFEPLHHVVVGDATPASWSSTALASM